MNQNLVISVNNLSKAFKMYSRPIDLVIDVFSRKKRYWNFWALRDISFDVGEGEIVGIIGRNGAGKSTLLKILAGTLNKTSGSVSISGKISAILELGTGFHPEYSGRENIYMGGLCLGMSKEEIDKKIDEIIDFSELGSFIEQPFKTYSSGMQGRLTFSVAMSVNPDIFIVDEALATGDALFQEKCYRRLKQICRQGKAVLLVTHSLYHIYEICTKCILLHNSNLVSYGDPRKIGDQYEKLLVKAKNASINNESVLVADNFSKNRKIHLEHNNDSLSVATHKKEIDTPKAQIISLKMLNSKNENTTTMILGKRYRVVEHVHFNEDIQIANVGFRVQKETGIVVFGDTTHENGKGIYGKKGDTISVTFEFTCRVSMGNYLLGGGVTEVYPDGSFYVCHLIRGGVILKAMGKQLNGLIDPDCKITIERNAGSV